MGRRRCIAIPLPGGGHARALFEGEPSARDLEAVQELGRVVVGMMWWSRFWDEIAKAVGPFRSGERS